LATSFTSQAHFCAQVGVQVTDDSGGRRAPNENDVIDEVRQWLERDYANYLKRMTRKAAEVFEAGGEILMTPDELQDYLLGLDTGESWGNKVTLVAAAHVWSLKIEVISAKGEAHDHTIRPASSVIADIKHTIYLGLYGCKEYVSSTAII
tara:strand:+ start:88 stop:537 length:450 start_codon:yes stop_codon:yes gene_type:complete